MKAREIEPYRRQLLQLVGRLSGDVSDLACESSHGLGGESGGGLSDLPTHLADLGTASSDQEMDLTLLARQEQMLDECNDALARIEAGTFGRCEQCHGAIARPRLRFAPFVRECIDCARRREARQAPRTGALGRMRSEG